MASFEMTGRQPVRYIFSPPCPSGADDSDGRAALLHPGTIANFILVIFKSLYMLTDQGGSNLLDQVVRALLLDTISLSN